MLRPGQARRQRLGVNATPPNRPPRDPNGLDASQLEPKIPSATSSVTTRQCGQIAGGPAREHFLSGKAPRTALGLSPIERAGTKPGEKWAASPDIRRFAALGSLSFSSFLVRSPICPRCLGEEQRQMSQTVGGRLSPPPWLCRKFSNACRTQGHTGTIPSPRVSLQRIPIPPSFQLTPYLTSPL